MNDAAHHFTRRVSTAGLPILLLLSLATETSAQRNLKKIPSPDPEIERKSFQVAPGFEVNLYASDPKIAKPIQMNFDPQGRLWIASSETYPQIKPGQQANDRILIVEDTNGDGRAEKTTVFASGLLIPTGIAPGDQGAYVANSTELLHLSDTNGDGRADTTRVVLSGFGTEDTHHILHTLRWGPDGRLYFNQSIYIHSHIETPWGVRRLNAGGIWRFQPETMRLEVLARGWVNSWGHHFDRFGQSFVTDGAGGEGINHLVPGAAYVTAVGVPRILRGLNPGSPKYCGLEIVSGRHLPEDWQGDLLTNDFRGNRVCRFKVTQSGSSYSARLMPDLIRTRHVAFRPIDIKMGPDGAIYIADWYNPIIQHGEVDFRDPRRDHVHGRIWRVTAKGRPLVTRWKPQQATISQLVRSLASPEMWVRRQARRTLQERPLDQREKIVSELDRWCEQIDPRHANADSLALEALWTYQAFDVIRDDLLARLLDSPDPRIRTAACRIATGYPASCQRELAARVRDSHPRVRLEAVRSLAGRDRGDHTGPLATNSTLSTVMAALEDDRDATLDYALWLTAWEQRSHWLPRIKSGDYRFLNDDRQLLYVLSSVRDPAIVPAVLDVLKRGELEPAGRDRAVRLLADLGGPGQLRLALDLALARGTPPIQQAALLNALAHTAGSRKLRPSGDLKAIAGLFSAESSAVRQAAVQCAGIWKQEALRDQVTALATNVETPDALRQVALESLASLGGNASGRQLRALATGTLPAPARLQALTALVSLDPTAAAELLSEVLSRAGPQADPSSVIRAFLSRKRGPATLTRALLEKELSEDQAKLALRAIDASGRKLPGLVAALQKAGGLGTGPQTLTPQQMQTLVAEVIKHGDAVRGEVVFRRGELACLSCHAIGGAGGRVGPDLVSLGASAPIDYLADSLLAPNRKVKENYHSLVVATKEGRVFTGIKLRQSNTELILRDAQDREIAVPLKSIEEQAAGSSLMPAGLTEKVTHQELLDLTRFLSQLGKPGPFAVSRRRLARRWQALDATQQARFRIRRTRDGQVTANDSAFNWSPRYATVSGMLPLAELPTLALRNRSVSFLRCELTVTTAGSVDLNLMDADGLTGWLGSDPLSIQASNRINLSVGRHRLTLAIDRQQRKTPLQLELIDVAGSAAQVRFVTGK